MGILALARAPLCGEELLALLNGARQAHDESGTSRPLEAFDFDELRGGMVRALLSLTRGFFDPVKNSEGEMRAPYQFFHSSLPQFIVETGPGAAVLTLAQVED